jgi:hypothetical protein
MLKLYGTIGFFAEDSMESIHAIVNTLANQFASLDKNRRCTQVLRVLASRKTCSMANTVEKKEKSLGDSMGMKKRKRQGKSKQLTPDNDTVTLDQQLKNAISSFINSGGNSADAVLLDDDCDKELLTFPKFTLVPCQKCLTHVDKDVMVPDVLQLLKEVMVHGDLGDKA